MKNFSAITWKSDEFTQGKKKVVYPTNEEGLLFRLINYYENVLYIHLKDNKEELKAKINNHISAIKQVCDYPQDKNGDKELFKQLDYPRIYDSGSKKSHKNERRRMYDGFARLLNWYFDIPEEIFEIPTGLSFNRIETVTDLAYQRPIHEPGAEPRLKALLRGKEQLRVVEKEFVERYLAAVSPLFDTLTSSLFIYDYVGKGGADNDADYLLAYSMAHDQVFKKIEALIEKKPEIIYRRLLAFPFAEKLTLESSEAELIGRFLELCTHSCFEHIVRCLLQDIKNTPVANLDRFSNPDSNSGFHIVPLTRRDYHFALFDDQFILSEYYKYSKNKHPKSRSSKKLHCVPDIMFIERNEGGLRVLYTKYEQDFKNLTKNSIRIASIQDLKIALESLIQMAEYNFGNSTPNDANHLERKNLLSSLVVKKEILNDLLSHS